MAVSFEIKLLRDFINFPTRDKGLRQLESVITDILNSENLTPEERETLNDLLILVQNFCTPKLDYVNFLRIPGKVNSFVNNAVMKSCAQLFKSPQDRKKTALQTSANELFALHAQCVPFPTLLQNKFYAWCVLSAGFLDRFRFICRKLKSIALADKFKPQLNTFCTILISVEISTDSYTQNVNNWAPLNLANEFGALKLKFTKPDEQVRIHRDYMQSGGSSAAASSSNQIQTGFDMTVAYPNVQYQQDANRNATLSPYNQSYQQTSYWPGRYGREVVTLQQAQPYAFPNDQNTRARGTTDTAYNYQNAQQNTHYNTSARYLNNQTGNQQLAITFDSTNTATQFSNQNTQDERVSVPERFSASDVTYLNQAVGVAADSYGPRNLAAIRQYINKGSGMKIQDDFARYIFTLTENGRARLAAALADMFAGTPAAARVMDILAALPDYIKHLSKDRLSSCFSQKLKQQINSQDDGVPMLEQLPNDIIGSYSGFNQIPNNLLPDLLFQCVESTTANETRNHRDKNDAPWFRKKLLSFLNSAPLDQITKFYRQITGLEAPDRPSLKKFWQFVLYSANNMPDTWYLEKALPATLSENRVHKKKDKKSSQRSPREYQLEQSFGEFDAETDQNINITAAASRATDNYGNQQAYGGFDGPSAVPPTDVNPSQHVQFDLPNSTADNYNNLNHTQNRNDAIQSQNVQFDLTNSAAYNNVNPTQHWNNSVFSNTYGNAVGPAGGDETTSKQYFQNATIPDTAAAPGRLDGKQNFQAESTADTDVNPTVPDRNTQIKQTQYADSSAQTTGTSTNTATAPLPRGFGASKGNETTPSPTKGKFEPILEDLSAKIARANGIDLVKGIRAGDFLDALQSLKN